MKKTGSLQSQTPSLWGRQTCQLTIRTQYNGGMPMFCTILSREDIPQLEAVGGRCRNKDCFSVQGAQSSPEGPMGLNQGPRHSRASSLHEGRHADVSPGCKAIQRTMGKSWGHSGGCGGVVSRSKTRMLAEGWLGLPPIPAGS